MFGRMAIIVGGLVLATACGGSDGPAASSGPSPSSDPSTSTEAPPESMASSTTESQPCTSDALEGGSVSTVGYDEITFGMTVAAAEEASGVCLAADRPESQDCYFVVPVPGPSGLAFLVTEGTIERVDVFGGDITTRSGLGIGSTQQAVIDQFGDRVSVTPHPRGRGNQLVFVPQDETDAEFRVVFETDGEQVTRFRSGRRPQVDRPRPCPGGEELGSVAPSSTTTVVGGP